MKQRRRIYFSAAQRAEIWDRWQAGESMKSTLVERHSRYVMLIKVANKGRRPRSIDAFGILAEQFFLLWREAEGHLPAFWCP